VIETGYVRCEVEEAYIMRGRHEISICIFRYLKCVTLAYLSTDLFMVYFGKISVTKIM